MTQGNGNIHQIGSSPKIKWISGLVSLLLPPFHFIVFSAGFSREMTPLEWILYDYPASSSVGFLVNALSAGSTDALMISTILALFSVGINFIVVYFVLHMSLRVWHRFSDSQNAH